VPPAFAQCPPCGCCVTAHTCVSGVAGEHRPRLKNKRTPTTGRARRRNYAADCPRGLQPRPPGASRRKTSSHRQGGHPSGPGRAISLLRRCTFYLASASFVTSCKVLSTQSAQRTQRCSERRKESRDDVKHKLPICKAETDSASPPRFPFGSERLPGTGPGELGQREVTWCRTGLHEEQTGEGEGKKKQQTNKHTMVFRWIRIWITRNDATTDRH